MSDNYEVVELDCVVCDDGVLVVPSEVEDDITEPTCGDCMGYDEDLARDDPPQSFIGCYFCDEGNGWVDNDMGLDTEFDVFYHYDCLADSEYDSVLEAETDHTGEHAIERYTDE